MITRDPAVAPARADLPWLRHRRTAAVAAAPPPPPSAPVETPSPARPRRERTSLRGPSGSSGSLGPSPATAPSTPPPPRTTPEPVPASGGSLDLGPAPTPPPPSLDLEPPPAPAPSSSLELDPPVTPPPTSLDLDGPAPAATGSSLDLSSPATSPAPPATTSAGTPATTSAGPAPAPTPAVAWRRLGAGDSPVLTRADPTVTLTRLQSGAGALQIRLIASQAIGTVRLGCAYQLTDGTSLVQRIGGPQTAPPDGRRPVIRASSDGGDLLTLDLLQVRRLSRMVVYLAAGSGDEVRWGGTMTVQTIGGSRILLPLDRSPSTGVLVALSIYNVDGELVLRHEDVLVDGPVREAAQAFGFDRITWVDDETPLI